MCKPFSCVIKSDLSILVGQKVTTHSHSAIMRQHGLPPEISIDQYARVELITSDLYPADPDKWELKLDEARAPSWWKENLPEIDDRVRQAAWAWLARIKATTEFHLYYGDILYLPFGSPVVTMSGGELWSRDESAPVVNGVQLRPGQMAEIVEGKLQITDF